MRDTYRQDLVATLGETTGLSALEKIRRKMLLDKTGRKLLRNKPLITPQTIQFDQLASLPQDTFGYAYYNFMTLHQLSPLDRTEVKYIGDDELAYIMLRYRQVHDFWHVLLGLPITVQAELAVKWFEWIQMGLPMNLLSVLAGPLRLNEHERDELFEKYAPWAIKCSSDAVFLMNVMYEDLFEEKLDVVRHKLNVFPPSF